MTINDQQFDDDRLTEIAESHPGDWYGGEWRSEYVESAEGEPAHYVVKHQESGHVLAELPDFAGTIALFIADAHDAVPELVAEVRRLRAQVAAVTDLCDAAEEQATRWEHPLPVPEWVAEVRRATAPAARSAAV